MSSFLHMLVPGAAVPGGDQRALPPLPNLQALLACMTKESVIEVDDGGPADPFELALARAYGLPDAPGRTPWAAYDTQTLGAACAWLAPAHLEAGMNDVRLSDPADVQISDEQSRALLQACAPLLAEDGIALRYVRSDAWLAQGEMFEGLTCWSPRRAAGRSLLPGQLLRADNPARQGKLLRLASELQMLLYAQPVNDARERAGLPAINALWIHGAGRLDQTAGPPPGRPKAAGAPLGGSEPRAAGSVGADIPPAPGVVVADELPSAPQAWTEAWQALDAGPVAELLAHLQNGGSARLTLCGPRRARTWIAAPRTSWRVVARRLFRPASVAAALEGL